MKGSIDYLIEKFLAGWWWPGVSCEPLFLCSAEINWILPGIYAATATYQRHRRPAYRELFTGRAVGLFNWINIQLLIWFNEMKIPLAGHVGWLGADRRWAAHVGRVCWQLLWEHRITSHHRSWTAYTRAGIEDLPKFHNHEKGPNFASIYRGLTHVQHCNLIVPSL